MCFRCEIKGQDHLNSTKECKNKNEDDIILVGDRISTPDGLAVDWVSE